MADNFGLKHGIDGEREFKKALSEINQTFKVLGSEMKLVSSQFDKNDKSIESLTARNQVLNKEIETQKEKIETLKSALANAAESFGENDKRTQAWQVQLNNAQASLNDMEREVANNEETIKDLSSAEDTAEKETKEMSEQIEKSGKHAEDANGKFEKFKDTVAKAAKAGALKIIKAVLIRMIFNHIVKQSDNGAVLVIHLRRKIKRMKDIRISAFIQIIFMRIKHYSAGFIYHIGIDHKFSSLISQ